MKPYTVKRALSAKPFEGNQSAFARAIGTSQQNVRNWASADKPLPAEYVLAAEKATGVPRHIWRPDIYPVPPSQILTAPSPTAEQSTPTTRAAA